MERMRGYRRATEASIKEMLGIPRLVDMVSFGIYNEHLSFSDENCGDMECHWIKMTEKMIMCDLVCNSSTFSILYEISDILKDYPKLSVDHALSPEDFCQFLRLHGFVNLDTVEKK